MSSQIVPIHRSGFTTTNNKNDIWFDPFNHQPGQDQTIRWLSRPNQEVFREKHAGDGEKFRITFDAENFQPDQIKIYIQNRRLTISGVYEERSEGRFMQKQFERTFDIPPNADVDSMASFITAEHMLVVEIPLHPANQVEHLNINNNLNDQRRLSFSLNKFNSGNNNQGLLSNLSAPDQQVRRTSITKTTTTTTTGSSALPPEAAELLRSAESTTGNTQTLTTRTTERRSSNTGQQPIVIHEPSSTHHTTLTNTDLANLPIEIPPELLATGGTITIQKRKVSVTKGGDTSNTDHGVSVPIHTNQDTHSNSTSSSTSERRSSKTISSSNQSRTLTLEEFLQNKIWNPTLIDGSDGKKILHMRLQMKPGTTLDQMKISLNGHDLRVEVDNKISTDHGRMLNEHSYRQISLFPTCEVDQLKTELKEDGYLHIQVPIKL